MYMVDYKVNGPYSYAVFLDGEEIGTVERDIRAKSSWFFRNDSKDWFGTVGSRREAIDALVELFTRPKRRKDLYHQLY